MVMEATFVVRQQIGAAAALCFLLAELRLENPKRCRATLATALHILASKTTQLLLVKMSRLHAAVPVCAKLTHVLGCITLHFALAP